MRILLLVQDPLGSGANFTRAESLGKEFERLGHEVWLAGPPGRSDITPGRDRASGIRWLSPPGLGRRLLLPAAFSPWILFGILGRVRALHPQIIHSFGHRPAASIPARFLQRRQHIRHVADWSDWWGAGGIAAERSWLGRRTVGALDEALERWSRRTADGLSVATRHLAAMARSWGIGDERILLLPGGARVDEIRPLPQEAARRKHGLDLGDRILVHAGQSAFDLPFAIDCFAEVARQEPRAKLMVIGDDRGRSLTAARRRGVQAGVVRFKYVPYGQLGELLACGDVMLLPFADLGLNLGRFPNRLGDYFASGRPVVTNTTGDLGRLFDENVIGLAAEATPQATAQAVLRVLSDPALAADLGGRGRRFAEHRMAWPIVAGEVLAFYERTPARSRIGPVSHPGGLGSGASGGAL